MDMNEWLLLLYGLRELVIVIGLVILVIILTIFEAEYRVVRLWIIATLIAYIAEWVYVFESMNCGRIQVLCTHAWLLPGWAYFIWLVIGVGVVIVVKAQEKDEIKRMVKAWIQ